MAHAETQHLHWEGNVESGRILQGPQLSATQPAKGVVATLTSHVYNISSKMPLSQNLSNYHRVDELNYDKQVVTEFDKAPFSAQAT